MQHTAMMLPWRRILGLILLASVAEVGTAQRALEAPPTNIPRLSRLSSAEAEALIEKLNDLQRRMRRGERLYFRLLSGAPASYSMTTVPPREAFLAMRFENPLSIERVGPDNRLWQSYKLVFAPNRPGLLWNVEVVLGFNGDVESVEMVHEPPPPS